MNAAKTMRYRGYDTYGGADAWFICDRCSQRHRRSAMLTEWTGLKVDAKCLDPRPPQMTPPDVYPEGLPFPDARQPQDNPDRLQDDTTLQSIMGGISFQNGLYHPDGQDQIPGALSPQMLVENPTPQGPGVLADDITFITGPVSAPTASDAPINLSPPTISGVPAPGFLLTAGPGEWE